MEGAAGMVGGRVSLLRDMQHDNHNPKAGQYTVTDKVELHM